MLMRLSCAIRYVSQVKRVPVLVCRDIARNIVVRQVRPMK